MKINCPELYEIKLGHSETDNKIENFDLGRKFLVIFEIITKNNNCNQ